MPAPFPMPVSAPGGTCAADTDEICH